MATDELAPIVRDELLGNACELNAPLEIWVGTEDDTKLHRSRFLALDESVHPARLVVEEPTAVDKESRLKRGSEFTVYFMMGGQRLAFTSRVTARLEFRLNKLTTVSALNLDYPEQLFRRQRRNFYRYQFPIRTAPQVQMAPEREGHRDEIYRWHRPLRDISGGGLSVAVPNKEFGDELALGVHLDLTFALEVPVRQKEDSGEGVATQTVEFMLVGEIRSMRAGLVDGQAITIIGLLFVAIESPKLTPLGDHLLRFIAARQREALQNGKTE